MADQIWTYETLAKADNQTLERIVRASKRPDLDRLEGRIYAGWIHGLRGRLTSIFVGGSGVAGGSGTINIQTGASVTANNIVVLWPNATVNLDGGSLFLNLLSPAGGHIDFNAGRLSFLANMNANDITINESERRL